MQIDHLVLGVYETNCYVLRKDGAAKDCLIIDTGLDAEPLLEHLRENDLKPTCIICTHGHADHIAAIPAVREAFADVKVVIHKNDSPMLTSPTLNLSLIGDMEIQIDPADIEIDCQGEVEFAGIKFDVLETPGHSPGGICLYSADSGVLFAGDTLFAGSIGRTDFDGYDQQKCFKQLVAGIKTKLLILPEETKVYPGHGPATTLRNEKKHNPYLN